MPNFLVSSLMQYLQGIIGDLEVNLWIALLEKSLSLLNDSFNKNTLSSSERLGSKSKFLITHSLALRDCPLSLFISSIISKRISILTLLLHTRTYTTLITIGYPRKSRRSYMKCMYSYELYKKCIADSYKLYKKCIADSYKLYKKCIAYSYTRISNSYTLM